MIDNDPHWLFANDLITYEEYADRITIGSPQDSGFAFEEVSGDE